MVEEKIFEESKIRSSDVHRIASVDHIYPKFSNLKVLIPIFPILHRNIFRYNPVYLTRLCGDNGRYI
jgi:hypothetical protein